MERHPRRPAERQVRHRAEPGLGERAAAQVFDFSEPYTISSAQLIVRADDTRQFRSLEDLKGLKLGVGQGTNYADLAKSVAGVNVRTYPGAPEYLQDLASNASTRRSTTAC